MKWILPLITGTTAQLIASLFFDAQGADGYLAFLLGYLQGEIWAKEVR